MSDDESFTYRRNATARKVTAAEAMADVVNSNQRLALNQASNGQISVSGEGTATNMPDDWDDPLDVEARKALWLKRNEMRRDRFDEEVKQRQTMLNP